MSEDNKLNEESKRLQKLQDAYDASLNSKNFVSDSKVEVKVPDLDRFAYLKEQAKVQVEKEKSFKDSYHYKELDSIADAKAMKESILAAAIEERKACNIDPLEMIKQIEIMRKEGFDESTIRAAFNDVMAEQSGTFRRPLRRVLKSENMTPMPSQEEINKMYFDRHGVKDGDIKDVKTDEKKYDKPLDEADVTIEAINSILAQIEKDKSKHQPFVPPKPTFRQKVRMLACRIAYRFLSGLIRVIVFVFGKLGVK